MLLFPGRRNNVFESRRGMMVHLGSDADVEDGLAGGQETDDYLQDPQCQRPVDPYYHMPANSENCMYSTLLQ